MKTKYVKLFEDYLNESVEQKLLTDDEIRMYSWLYFVTVVYPNGMNIESWKNDNRMGISFETSMNWLQSKKLTYYDNGTWKSTEDSLPILYDIFGKYDNRAEVELSDISRLVSLKGKQKYPIEQIPYEMFDKLQFNKERIYNLMYDVDEYRKIEKWYAIYQRTPGIGWNNTLSKYTGAVGDLIDDIEYVIYRGIYIKSEINNYRIGEIYSINNAISWTSSFNMADAFSRGREHWQDYPKNEKGRSSIIFKCTPSKYDILLDTEYIKKHPVLRNVVDFEEEFEIICNPNNLQGEVIQMINF